MEAQQLRLCSAFVPRQEEPGRVEPGLLHPPVQVLARPGPLLGVLGERRGVEDKPPLIVFPGHEGADGDAGRQRRSSQRCKQAAPELEQLAHHGEPAGAGQAFRGVAAAVGPQAQPAVGRGSLERVDQRAADTGAAVRGWTTTSALEPATASVVSRWA